MKLQDLREMIEFDSAQLDEAGWDFWKRLFRSTSNDAPGGGIRHLQGYDPGMLPYGGQGYWIPRRDPWGGRGWPPTRNSPGTQYHPPRSGPDLYGRGYHPNNLNWYWDAETGGWVKVNPGQPMPPGVRFPQPPTPAGDPGFSYPHHSPNGYPIGPDGQEMPVNPDTGTPWTNDPYTNQPYGSPPPWETVPPGSGGYPDYIHPNAPDGGIDVDVDNSGEIPIITPTNPMLQKRPETSDISDGGGDIPRMGMDLPTRGSEPMMGDDSLVRPMMNKIPMPNPMNRSMGIMR